MVAVKSGRSKNPVVVPAAGTGAAGAVAVDAVPAKGASGPMVRLSPVGKLNRRLGAYTGATLSRARGPAAPGGGRKVMVVLSADRPRFTPAAPPIVALAPSPNLNG